MAIWHASIIEIIWTMLGLIGMYFANKNLKASKDDIDALNRMNGKALGRFAVMRIVAYGHYRNDLFRLAKHATIFFIGVTAMIIPASSKHQPVTPTGLIITGGLFAISILLVLASVLDKRQRDALEGME